jgi:hypothetical protein
MSKTFMLQVDLFRSGDREVSRQDKIVSWLNAAGTIQFWSGTTSATETKFLTHASVCCAGAHFFTVGAALYCAFNSPPLFLAGNIAWLVGSVLFMTGTGTKLVKVVNVFPS